MRAGTTASEIVRFAHEHEFDLIVMGYARARPVGHMVMGSVAEKVVRTAPCPVLTVRLTAQAAHDVVVGFRGGDRRGSGSVAIRDWVLRHRRGETTKSLLRRRASAFDVLRVGQNVHDRSRRS